MKVLDKKLKKVLDMKTDSPEMLRALGALSSFYGPQGNTLEARRSLRADLEERNIMLAQQFIDSFKVVENRLQRLDSAVEELCTSCKKMQRRLDGTETSTRSFLSVTDALKSKKEQKRKRFEMMSSFLERFELSQKQLDALRNISVQRGGGRDFFEALDVVAKIREDCQGLLTTQYQKVGLDVLEKISEHESKALGRLFDWTRERVYASMGQEEPPADPYLTRAFAMLRASSTFRRLSADLVARVRAETVETMFKRALTLGGSAGAIEMHAHNPTRYAGDMLAWVHQAIVSERDLLLSMFPTLSKDTASNDDDDDDDDNDDIPTGVANKDARSKGGKRLSLLVKSLDQIMSSVAPLLRSRLGQAVTSAARDLVVLYELAKLLDFYGDMTTGKKLLSSEGPITLAITQSAADAKSRFDTTLQKLSDKLIASPPNVSNELVPPPVLEDTIAELLQILKSQKSSPTRTHSEKEAAFLPTLTAFVHPLLQMCVLSTRSLQPADTAIYMINCASAIQGALSSFDFVSHWMNKLVEEIDSWMDVLVREHADAILRQCGLEAKLRLMSTQKGRLADIDGLRGEEICASMKKLYASTFSLAMPQFDRVRNPRLRAQARRAMCDLLAQAHRTIFDAITHRDSGYENPMSVVIHSPARVRTLLGLD